MRKTICRQKAINETSAHIQKSCELILGYVTFNEQIAAQLKQFSAA
jgi:hypothetical protein